MKKYYVVTDDAFEFKAAGLDNWTKNDIIGEYSNQDWTDDRDPQIFATKKAAMADARRRAQSGWTRGNCWWLIAGTIAKVTEATLVDGGEWEFADGGLTPAEGRSPRLELDYSATVFVAKGAGRLN